MVQLVALDDLISGRAPRFLLLFRREGAVDWVDDRLITTCSPKKYTESILYLGFYRT